MEWSDFAEGLELPIFYPSLRQSSGQPLVAVEDGGVVIFEPWYGNIVDKLDALAATLNLVNYTPSVNGAHPSDILGDIIFRFEDIGLSLSWPLLLLAILLTVKLEGWLIQGKHISVEETTVMHDSVSVTEMKGQKDNQQDK